MRFYHRFAYSAPINEGDLPRPFKTRDGAAFNELTARFPELNYTYDGLIYNYPFSPRFAPDHIRSMPGFATRMAKPTPKDEVSRFIAKNISDGARKLLSSVSSGGPASDAQKSVLVDELNDFVDGESLYAEERFKNVRLLPATEALVTRDFLGKKEVARLNRYLLEDAFPDEFERIHEILKLGPAHFAFLRTDLDTLVLTTRPPLDDERHEDKKYVARSHTDLENAVFESIRHCIEECARNKVRLAADMRKHLKGDAVQKAEMRFHLNRDGRLVQFLADGQPKPSAVRPDEYVTTGFFMHLPRIERYGCQLIASFGMGGIETLIWNRIVRNHSHYRTWMTQPTFVVAELNLANMPSHPITLGFTDQIKFRLLLEQPL